MIFDIDIFSGSGYNKKENTNIVPAVHSLREENNCRSYM